MSSEFSCAGESRTELKRAEGTNRPLSGITVVEQRCLVSKGKLESRLIQGVFSLARGRCPVHLAGRQVVATYALVVPEAEALSIRAIWPGEVQTISNRVICPQLNLLGNFRRSVGYC